MPSAPTVFSIWALGDGNSYRNDNAQRMTTLLGKFLRIDIRGTTGTALYQIPADNPFAASTAFCNVNGYGHAELSRDLRLGLSQSLGLGLRSPDR